MKKISPRYAITLLTAALFSISALQAETIDIYPAEKDMTREIQAAIHLSREKKHAPVTIQLRQGDYHISRSHASHQLYYISNTTSSSENPHPVKHNRIVAQRTEECNHRRRRSKAHHPRRDDHFCHRQLRKHRAP